MLALCVLAARGSEICKWTDAQGKVHCSQSPPGNTPAHVVPVQSLPAPVPPQRRELAQSIDRPEDAVDRAPPVAPSARPGPLPGNQASEYIRTLATSLSHNFNQGPPRYRSSITVRVRADVPVGAVLVATFDDTGAAGRVLQTTARAVLTSRFPQMVLDYILILSPSFIEVRCQDYTVLIKLYEDERSSTPLGTHRQLIQSRTDSTLLRTNPGLITQLPQSDHVYP